LAGREAFGAGSFAVTFFFDMLVVLRFSNAVAAG
jgi:hypothetical protein